MISVAIVGGGPSSLYALKALSASPQVGEIALFEAADRWGLGTPYDPVLNHPSLLANIASYELPALVETLAGWLASLDDAQRAAIGVGEVSERAFYPRVALGAYFEAQLAKLSAAAGSRVRLRRATRVRDVRCGPDGVTILFTPPGGRLESAAFDFVILATGHRSGPVSSRPWLTAPAYPPPEAPLDRPFNAAILGASLTAIDATLTMAIARGDYATGPRGLTYSRRADAAPLKVTMLSRHGLLPEADFYFPYPYEPLEFCNAESLAKANSQGGLDAAFALFKQELRAQDPQWADAVSLDGLTPETFAEAYFASRGAQPFAAARRNLAEVRENERLKRVSAYRYAILRAHEAFSDVAPHLSPRDRVRFQRGLVRTFVDNYAAVPPLSVERLLALHDAGVLEVERIASDYRLEAAEKGVTIVTADKQSTYDVVVDARGEGEAAPYELPFPTLRLQILANQMLSGAHNTADLEVTDALGLAPGVNPVERVYCLAAPFLLSRRPFVQGLTSAHELAERAVADLLRRAAAPSSASFAPAGAGALYLGDGLVVTTAAHMS